VPYRSMATRVRRRLMSRLRMLTSVLLKDRL
jgi:hypothetical protein